MGGNDCGFQFSPGEEYVYFVFNGVVSRCGRVAPHAELLERLRALRVPEPMACEGIPPLEFRGDWARVRVSVPSQYCADRELKSTVREGWIRWRSPERGLWVWYYTRGC